MERERNSQAQNHRHRIHSIEGGAPRRTCVNCGRLTQSVRGRASRQCGPCWMGKPATWWDDADAVIKRVCGLPRPAQENDDD